MVHSKSKKQIKISFIYVILISVFLSFDKCNYFQSVCICGQNLSKCFYSKKIKIMIFFISFNYEKVEQFIEKTTSSV